MPFFPRVLVHLVRFDHVIVQRVLVQSPPGVLLKSVPQIQEAHAVAVQFAGQLGRRHALGDAAEDGQDLGGTTLGALEDGASEGVEDAPAGPTLVVQDGVAVASVDAEVVALSAAWTGQAVGVQQFDEPVVTGRLIEQIGHGKVHGGRSPVAQGNHLDDTNPP